MSLFGFGGCKCSGYESADPAKDTVKFTVEDKENTSPQVNDEMVAAAAKEARERERVEADAKHQLELEEERKRAAEQQRQLEEEAREQREAEERRQADERRQAEERAEETRRAAEEAEVRRRALEAEEERLREEEASREREAREAEQAATKKKVEDFLKKHGYATVNTKRKSKFGRYKFALHTAVKHDPEIVPLLLEMGADSSNKDSKGQTPCEYAKKMKSSAESILRSTPQK